MKTSEVDTSRLIAMTAEGRDQAIRLLTDEVGKLPVKVVIIDLCCAIMETAVWSLKVVVGDNFFSGVIARGAVTLKHFIEAAMEKIKEFAVLKELIPASA
jgi:hypothetical protein